MRRTDLDDINLIRAEAGLPPLKLKIRVCLKCGDKILTTPECRLCDTCRRVNEEHY